MFFVLSKHFFCRRVASNFMFMSKCFKKAWTIFKMDVLPPFFPKRIFFPFTAFLAKPTGPSSLKSASGNLSQIVYWQIRALFPHPLYLSNQSKWVGQWNMFLWFLHATSLRVLDRYFPFQVARCRMEWKNPAGQTVLLCGLHRSSSSSPSLSCSWAGMRG